MTTRWEQLRAAYDARTAADGVAPDVVGVIGGDVPDELLHAAGLRPLRLRGAPAMPTPIADSFVEQAIDPAARSVFERVLDGTYGGLRRLVLCHDSEASVRLFYYLRELRRIEPDRGVPELYFVDVLHQPVRTSTAYTIGRMAAFRDVLSRWSGREVGDDVVREAIGRGNERRRWLHRLAGLRRANPAALSGTEALTVIGAGMSMDVDDYLPLVQAMIEERSAVDVAGGPVRLYVTGTAHERTGLYREIEATGAVVVGENHDRGEVWAEGLVDDDADPMRALAVHYQYRGAATGRSSITARARHTADAARAAGAAGVVCVLRRGDNGPYWDVPEQRRALDDAGLPMLVLDVDAYRDELTGDQRDAVASFVSGLDGRPPTSSDQEVTA